MAADGHKKKKAGLRRPQDKSGLLRYFTRNSCVLLVCQNLAAPIHTGLQIDMVRTAKLAGILVFDIGRCLERIGCAAHAALRAGHFTFGYGHFLLHSRAIRARRPDPGRNRTCQFRKLRGLIHGKWPFGQHLPTFFVQNWTCAAISDFILLHDPALGPPGALPFLPCRQ